MNDDKMTAEQAWAEADRREVEAEKARLIAVQAEHDWRAKDNATADAWAVAEAIGPRPVKQLPESACRHRACDGSGRTATGDGKVQLCICLVPE